ncbi:MAG: ECF transporter S component [Oscillospiraceae bacterium]|nr:ECF transporter S component [Oscillospiraceae bacterium]
MKKPTAKETTIRLTVTALFMAINVALSSFGVPVPGGHLYLNDIIICVAAIILNPFEAFCVGGIGAFLGDFFFYPTPMFVSLVTHGLQAIVISLFSHYVLKNKKVLASSIGVAIGAVIMVAGYSLGRAFIYSTPEYAILKLPYQIAQAAVGAVLGVIFVYKFKLPALLKKITKVNFE